MSITAADVQARFPSLETVPTPLINLCITAAGLRIKASVWGVQENEGLLHLTAHLVTLDPAGNKARKVDKSGESLYQAEYNRLVRIVSSGFRVSGDTSGITI